MINFSAIKIYDYYLRQQYVITLVHTSLSVSMIQYECLQVATSCQSISLHEILHHQTIVKHHYSEKNQCIIQEFTKLLENLLVLILSVSNKSGIEYTAISFLLVNITTYCAP